MAKILNFRSVDLRRQESAFAASERASRERASAEVIVFPGVRYERWDQADDAALRPKSTTKRAGDQRRDILELAE